MSTRTRAAFGAVALVVAAVAVPAASAGASPAPDGGAATEAGAADVASATSTESPPSTDAPPGSAPEAPTTTTEAPTTTTAAPPPVVDEAPEEEQAPVEEEVFEEEVFEEGPVEAEGADDTAEAEVVEEAPAPRPTTTIPPRPEEDAEPEEERGSTSSVVAVVEGAGDEVTGNDPASVVRLVMALLVVVGLLILTLTARYWWYTNPRRGLAPSRLLLPDGFAPGPGADADGVLAGGPMQAEELLDDGYVVHGELVGAAATYADVDAGAEVGEPTVAVAPARRELFDHSAELFAGEDVEVRTLDGAGTYEVGDGPDTEPVPVTVPEARHGAGLWRAGGAGAVTSSVRQGLGGAGGRRRAEAPSGDEAGEGFADEPLTVQAADVLSWADGPGAGRPE